MQHDTWGSGAAGPAGVFVTGSGEQHAFARGKTGTLGHWWWTSSTGIPATPGVRGSPETRPPRSSMLSSTSGRPAAAGRAQHWFWDPSINAVNRDDWGQ